MDNYETNLYDGHECNKLRDRIYSILDICRVYTHDREFKNDMASYLNWLGRLSDADFYHHQNRQRVNRLKNFLEHLEDNIPKFNVTSFENYNAYIRTKEALIQSRTNNPSFRFFRIEEVYQYSLDELYAEIVSELEFIFTRIPPSNYEYMKEKNEQFYEDLNKYVLKPERIERFSQKFGLEFFDYLDAIFD